MDDLERKIIQVNTLLIRFNAISDSVKLHWRFSNNFSRYQTHSPTIAQDGYSRKRSKGRRLDDE